ncbi:peroxisomal membrane protein PEX13 [Myzus persicae]|uniref:peroxisomal membrane protein PEX13 n=1 Tax=Myzus persicae TaxID=13164 RepID=UPI000B93444F|nr:peroxisomal membrane protein PEX13 [Myzus persicae]
MNDHEFELNNIIQRSTQLLQNIQTGAAVPARVAPPMTTTSTHPPITSPNHPLNSGVPRVHRRATNSIPTQYSIPSIPGIPSNAYNGQFNNYGYRGMTNMNIGGFNPYNTFGQLPNTPFTNPYVNAASENSRPAFDSIQSVVQSFNSISMMLESTFTAMHMSFQAILSVAENFSRLRMFMMKLYSTIVSFKLARWFLTKLFYLLKMVRGGSGSSTEEDLWATLSSADNHREIITSDGRSWPLVVFTGLLVSTPYLVYKLLNSVTPVAAVAGPTVNNSLPSNMIIATAHYDWSSTDPKTIPLVKGKSYLTSQEYIALARETGWLRVDSCDGKQGYVPFSCFKARKTDIHSIESQRQYKPNVSTNNAPSNSIPQQVQPKSSTPVTDVHGNPISLPHPLVDCDKSNIGRQ